MEIYINPPKNQWSCLCERPMQEDPIVKERVSSIIQRVREGGDSALKAIETEICGLCRSDFRVSAEEIELASEAVSVELKEAIANAAENIKAFHKAQLPNCLEVVTAPEVKCIQKPIPINSVGLYIPGGTAPLFSTVLMLAIPAKLAGCPRVVLCTPVGRDGKISPAVLFAASFCGIDEIYALGGAQAIAAMAIGTESIEKVFKIFGPGNRYVTTAKQMLSGRDVSIDMPAGPSEVMVIADEQANAAFIAADLLSQAEHGIDSQVMLLSSSEAKVNEVLEQTEKQLALLDRADFARKALDNSRALVFSEESDIVNFANTYAPEHLIIQTAQPWSITDQITAAGSVFVGAYTPESAGDYASGTNHTLPTSSWAHSCSGVNIDSYIRKMTIQEISREGLKSLGRTIVTMAEAEGLDAHANAVKVRME